MIRMTQAEWDALPQWQAVTHPDGSRTHVWRTGGRWPKLEIESVEIVPEEAAEADAFDPFTVRGAPE